MKLIIKRSYSIFALVIAFFIMLSILIFRFFTDGNVWVTKPQNRHIFSNGQLIKAGKVLDAKGVELVQTKNGNRIYNNDYYVRKSSLHVVGDPSGIISSGVQSLYRSSIIGYDKINGLYNTVNGRQKDIELTIDSVVNSAAYKALNGAKGAIIVYNYKTGEVPCMVSTPSYDVNDPPSIEKLNSSSEYEGVYINRCTNGVFTPGSTMKIITTIAALQNISDINKQSWNCTGSITINGEKINCSGVHGKQNLEQALNHSCNVAFADIANQLGGKKLQKVMNELGMKTVLHVGRISSSKCTYNVKNASDYDLGWAGVGQYTTMVTPLHMLSIVGTIANGGKYIQPYIIKQASNVRNESGIESKSINIDEKIANTMNKLLRSNVKNYYGESKFPNLQMTGKTGTAERGSVNGVKLRHCWYVGYSQRDDFPYAVVVIMENLKSGSGYSIALPAANKVLQTLKTQKGIK